MQGYVLHFASKMSAHMRIMAFKLEPSKETTLDNLYGIHIERISYCPNTYIKVFFSFIEAYVLPKSFDISYYTHKLLH
jgi:hypothetical protein